MSQDQENSDIKKTDDEEVQKPKGPAPKVKKAGVATICSRAFRAMTENMFVLLLLIGFSAYLDAFLLESVFEANNVKDLKEVMTGGAAAGQSQLITVVLSWTGLHLLKVILLGPLIAATIVYTGRNYTQNKSSGFSTS